MMIGDSEMCSQPNIIDGDHSWLMKVMGLLVVIDTAGRWIVGVYPWFYLFRPWVMRRFIVGGNSANKSSDELRATVRTLIVLLVAFKVTRLQHTKTIGARLPTPLQQQDYHNNTLLAPPQQQNNHTTTHNRPPVPATKTAPTSTATTGTKP